MGITGVANFSTSKAAGPVSHLARLRDQVSAGVINKVRYLSSPDLKLLTVACFFHRSVQQSPPKLGSSISSIVTMQVSELQVPYFSRHSPRSTGTCTFAEFSKGIRALELPLTGAQVRHLWNRS